MHWIAPILNVAFAAFMAARAVTRWRALAFYWILAAIFGIMICRDLFTAPFGFPPGYLPAMMTQDNIAGVAWFVLGCNMFFAMGEGLARLPFKRPVELPVTLTVRDRYTSKLIWVYLAFFITGCVFYLPSIAHFTYYDYVNDDRWLLSRQLFISSMPLGPLAWLLRKRLLALLPLASGVAIVMMVHVRDFLLYSAFPLLILLLLAPAPEGKRPRIMLRVIGVGVGACLLVAFAAYIVFLRTNKLSFPEESLTRGMYLVVEQVDHGAAMTGTDSLEIAAKSLAWPIYNRHLTPGYSLPNNPSYYLPYLVTKSQSALGIRGYVFLWYTDVYLAMGWRGMFQGLIWGALFGAWETLIRKNPVVWAAYLPLFTYTMYIFTRGAVSTSISLASPLIYTQLLILVAGFIWSQDREKRAQDYMNEPSHAFV